MTKKAILGALLVALTGCAESLRWHHPSGGASFQRDNYECVRDSRTPWGGGGTGLIGAALILGSMGAAQTQADRMYNMCMHSKGYYLVKEQEQAGPESPVTAPAALPSPTQLPPMVPPPAGKTAAPEWCRDPKDVWTGFSCHTRN